MEIDTMIVKIIKENNELPLEVHVNSNVPTLPIPDVIPNNALRVDGFTDIVQKVIL